MKIPRPPGPPAKPPAPDTGTPLARRASHVVGNAASAGPGTGSGTAASSGWLDGMTLPAAGSPGGSLPAGAIPGGAVPDAPGVPVQTQSDGQPQAGQGLESRRGRR